MSVRTPKYRLHKPTGQALVEIRGRRIYLGKFGTPESKERYRQILANHFSGGPVDGIDQPSAGDDLSISELILRYFQHAQRYYVKGGEPTDEVACIKAALKALRQLYGELPARKLRPRMFKLVRESLVQRGLSRKYVNDSMARICRMFAWAASEELVPVSVHESIVVVPRLAKGRSAARDSEPVAPVSGDVFETTLPHCPKIVADMARVQRLTGCRPQEICLIRPADIDRTHEVWEYRPLRHKGEHHDRNRVIFIGPRAQQILSPYLLRPSESYCLAPSDSVKAHGKLTPKVQRMLRSHYDRHSYRQAIQRACRRAGVQKWSPNQLRHTAATYLRQQFDLETAQSVLGHSRMDVTEIYAARDMDRARQAMRQIG